MAQLADETFLIRAGRLADKQPVGVLVADAEHALGAGLMEFAGSAACYSGFKIGPIHASRIAQGGLISRQSASTPYRPQPHFLKKERAPARHNDNSIRTASSRPSSAG